MALHRLRGQQALLNDPVVDGPDTVQGQDQAVGDQQMGGVGVVRRDVGVEKYRA